MTDTNTLPLFAPANPPAADATLPAVTLITDGACKPNPGNGGWCAILVYGEKRLVISGAEPNTTNNRMEFVAAIEGLRRLKKRARVLVRTDSMILVRTLNRTGRKLEKRKNQDLVRALIVEADKHDTRAEFVRGHNGDPDNEECDHVAQALARNGSV